MSASRRSVRFFVTGLARSTQTGSIVRAGGRSIPIRRGTAWSAYCRLVAQQHRPEPLLGGFLAVRLTFLMPRLKNARDMGDYPRSGADLDNLFKGVGDAFQGILYADDRQVKLVVLRSDWAAPGQPTGLRVQVRELPPRKELTR